MWIRVKTPAALLPTLALVLTSGVAGCSSDPTPTAPTPTDAGVVHLPTSSAPTTDSAGHRIQPLPGPGTPIAMSEDRIRGMEYSCLQPVGWSKTEGDLEPAPDTFLQPNDDGVRAFIAVERPITVGSHSLTEVVDRLRDGFTAKGFTPLAAPEREVAGYRAMGIVVNQSDDIRHVYYVVTYAEQIFAIRLTYDPAHGQALDVFRAVLDSWSWG